MRYPTDLLNEARALRDRGDLTGALEASEAAARAHPEEPAAVLEVVRALRALGRGRESLTRCRALVAARPDHHGARRELIVALRLHGALDEAAAVLSALDGDPAQRRFVSMQRAYLRKAAGDHAGALEAFEALSLERPEDPTAGLEVVRALRALGREAEARARRQALAAALPGDRGVRREQVVALRVGGALDEAEAALDDLDVDPADRAFVAAQRAHLRKARDDLAGALEAFQALADERPEDSAPKLEVVRLLRALGREPEALARCRSLAAERPDDHSVQRELVRCLIELGDFDAAAEALGASESVGAAPFSAIAGGLLAERSGHPERALEIVREGLSRFPSEKSLEAAEFRLLWRLGELGAIERVLETARPSYAVQMQKGKLAVAAEDAAAALSAFDAARGAAPARWPAYVEMARVLRQEGSFEAALAVLDAAPHSVRRHPRLEMERGFTHAHAGRADAAMDTLDQQADVVSPGLRSQRIAAFILLGRFERAERELETWPEQSPARRAAKGLSRGALALARWRFEAAREAFEDAARLGASPAECDSGRGLALLQAQDYPASAQALRSAHERRLPRHRFRGRTAKFRQTFLGQILNELELSVREPALLQEVVALPTPSRLERTHAVVARDRGALAPALALMVGLRRAGALSSYGAAPKRAVVKTRIPAKIWQFWDAKTPPDQIAALIAGWRALNPGYEHRVLDERAARLFLLEHGLAAPHRAFSIARHAAQKADLLRLALLLVEGGVYADADDACVGPIWNALPDDARFVGCQERYGSVANNFLATEPGLPLIEAALESVTEAILGASGEPTWLSGGPGLLTRMTAAFAFESGGLAPGFHLAAEHELRPQVVMHVPVKYRRTEQSWVRSMQMRQV